MKLEDAINLAYHMIPNLEEHVKAIQELRGQRHTVRYMIIHYQMDFIFTTFAGIIYGNYRDAVKHLADDIKRKDVEKYRPILEWYEKVNNVNKNIFGCPFFYNETEQQLINALAENKHVIDFY